jgi:hypothetical protein
MLVGETIVAVAGPELSFQLTDLIVAPLLPLAEPESVTELVGSVISGSPPALTVGASELPALTVTVIDPFAVFPLLSVA